MIRERVAACRSLLPVYPFGCDFSEVELQAAKALQAVAASSAGQKAQALLRRQRPTARASAVLTSLDLEHPQGLKQRLLARLLQAQLQS